MEKTNGENLDCLNVFHELKLASLSVVNKHREEAEEFRNLSAFTKEKDNLDEVWYGELQSP